MPDGPSGPGGWGDGQFAHRGALFAPGVDDVLGGDHEPQPHEGAGRKYREQEAAVVLDQGERQRAPGFTEHELGLGEERAVPDELAQAAEGDQDQGEAEPDGQAIHQGAVHRVLGGEGLGAPDDVAIDHDSG